MTLTMLFNIFYIVIIILFAAALLFILLYAFEQVYLKNKSKKNIINQLPEFDDKDLPYVTIQLPIYNEKYVVEALLESIFSIDYPTDRLEIQILDDSTDETSKIIDNFIQHSSSRGLNVEHIQRSERSGFKAGALKYGLKTAKGDFITIFDSDFRPHPNFLKETLRYFTINKIAAVQTRWGFEKSHESIFTLIQRVLITNHFLVEQYGRYTADLFLQFSGTAGIWRKDAIIEAGGWQYDTIIEDVDLSMRTQLKGRKIVLAKDVICPGEVPSTIHGIKTQQFRWMQGAAQVAKKHLGTILCSNIGLRKKYHAFIYLTTAFVYLAMFGLAFLSVPFLWILNDLDVNIHYTGFFFVLILVTGMIFYRNTKNEFQSKSYGQRLLAFLHIFFYLVVLNFGISFQNAVAIIKGLAGIETPFKRTPKFSPNNKNHYSNHNYAEKKDIRPIWEIVIAIYFIFGVALGFKLQNFILIDFHICMVLAFTSISILTLRPQKKRGEL